jgi:pimeloyl-ACP methyl ester carboxylesterase
LDPASGQGLTLLHGAGARGDLWQLQALAFPRALTPELAGRDGVGTPTSIAGHLLSLGPVLDAAAVLAGHSLGGAVALQYALGLPAGLRGVILIETGARFPEAKEWVRQPLEEASLVALTDRSFGPAATPRLREKSLAILRALDPRVIRADFEAAASFDVRDRLGGMLLPALVIAGSADRMVAPRHAEFLSAHLPRAELVWIEGAGHMVMLEQPHAVNQAIRRFLERLKREESVPPSRYNR